MKIALVSPYDLGIPGGVQSHVVLLARALRDAGEQVAVIGPGSSASGSHTTGGSLRIPFNGSVAPVGLGPVSGWRTRRLLAGLRPDVVHVHEPLVPAVGLAAATSRVAPVVATFHAWSASDRAYRAVRPVGRRVLDGLGAAIAVSPAAAAYHAGALGVPVERFEVVPNGVDVSRFATATADPAPGLDAADGADPSHATVSRRPSGEEGDEETLLFVGRLEPRKGLATLIRAFVALRAARPRLRLTVVGEGSERDRCRRLVPDAWRDDVRFVGRVDGAALVRHFAAADLYVSPALGGESFGIVLLEAMAAGRPVIASDIPGYRSVVTPGRDGVLVAPDDPDDLAAAIDSLLDDPARQAAMIAAGHATAEAHDWSVVAERLRAVYARVLARA